MAASNILETFFILFDTNADKLKKGNKDAEQSSNDLETALSRTDAAGTLMGEHLVGALKEVAVAFVGAFALSEIKDAIFEVGELTDQMGKSAKRLGVDIESFDAWGQAVDRAGGSAAGFEQSLDFLNKGMADIAVKGKSRLSPFFDELGIKVLDSAKKVKPLFDVYRDLNVAFQKLSAQERAGYAEKLGLDPGLLAILSATPAEFDKLIARQKALGTITQESADKAEKFNDQWSDVKQIFRNVAAAIGDWLFPKLYEVLKLVEQFTGFLGTHKNIVEGFFIGLAGIIGAVYLPTIISATVATIAFLAPWLAIGAAVIAVAAAFAFLYDDIQNFMKGNDSVIGELSKTWPELGETVKAAVAFIGEAFDVLMVAVKWLFDLWASEIKLGVAIATWFAGAVKDLFEGVGHFFSEMWSNFSKVFPGLTAGLKAVGSVLEWFIGLIATAVGWFAKLGLAGVAALPKALGNAADAINAHNKGGKAPAENEAARNKRIADKVADWDGHKAAEADAQRRRNPLVPPVSPAVLEGVQRGRGAIHTADTTPLAATSPGALAAGREPRKVEANVNLSGPITIHTQATDADGVAAALGDHLKGHIRQAINHADDGVQS